MRYIRGLIVVGNKRRVIEDAIEHPEARVSRRGLSSIPYDINLQESGGRERERRDSRGILLHANKKDTNERGFKNGKERKQRERERERAAWIFFQFEPVGERHLP